jgi:hypothetical protein
MAIKCSTPGCGISCDTDACSCTSSMSSPESCSCECIQSQPGLAKGVKKINIVRFKRKIIANPQSRYNITCRNVPITTLALSYDAILPKRILIPANNLTKKVNLTLKNKTFKQIVIASGLILKV